MIEVELSDAEHLFEYARQMVRCDEDYADLDDSAPIFSDFSGAHMRLDQVEAEKGKLTEMVAGLTSSQASTAEHALLHSGEG